MIGMEETRTWFNFIYGPESKVNIKNVKKPLIQCESDYNIETDKWSRLY